MTMSLTAETASYASIQKEIMIMEDPPITYNTQTGKHYIKPEHTKQALKEIKKNLQDHLRFAHNGYLNRYQKIAEEIAEKNLKKYEHLIFDEQGRIDLNKLNPEIQEDPELKQIHHISNTLSRKEIKNKMRHIFLRTGYFDVQNRITQEINNRINEEKGLQLYNEVLSTPIGESNAQEILILVLGNSATEYVGRNKGWGSYLFACAHETGMEEKTKKEFTNRIRKIYEHSYQKALNYFSQENNPTKATQLTRQTLQRMQGTQFLIDSKNPDSQDLNKLSQKTLKTAKEIKESSSNPSFPFTEEYPTRYNTVMP